MTGASTEILKIPVAGGLLEAELWARGSTKSHAPILFLHGWTLDRRMWAPQMDALSLHQPVIAIDRRGFGQSTAPAGLHLEPDDIIAIQDTLSVRSAVIVGMSQAGRIALEFAVRHPERTTALVLEGAGLAGFMPPPKKEEQIPLALYRSLVEAGDLEEMRKKWREHPLMQSPNPDAARYMIDILRSYDGRDLLSPSSQPFGVGPDALDRIEPPVLTVTGEQETPWRQLVADAIAYGVSNGRRAVVENAGHVCNLCNAESYNAVFNAFLNEVLN